MKMKKKKKKKKKKEKRKRKRKKKQLKINYPHKTNFRSKLSLWLIVIVPIILFDKFVDAMDLNKNYLFLHFHDVMVRCNLRFKVRFDYIPCIKMR